jgi:hypothetical protein
MQSFSVLKYVVHIDTTILLKLRRTLTAKQHSNYYSNSVKELMFVFSPQSMVPLIFSEVKWSEVKW